MGVLMSDTRKRQAPEQTQDAEDVFSSWAVDYHQQNPSTQAELTHAALRLLNPSGSTEGGVILDVGCGSGLSTKILTQLNYIPIGMDLSLPMLNLARNEIQKPFNQLCVVDFSQHLPFRDCSFDLIISISAIQWLVDVNNQKVFFGHLYRMMTPHGKGVFQFYPTDKSHALSILEASRSIGFHSELVLDYPHRNPQRKWFLCIEKFNPSPHLEILCELSLPYGVPCSLCYQHFHQGCSLEHFCSISMVKAKNAPLRAWTARQHIIRALEFIRYQKSGHSSWNYTLSKHQLSISNSLAEQFPNASFTQLQLHFEQVLSALHIQNNSNPSDTQVL